MHFVESGNPYESKTELGDDVIDVVASDKNGQPGEKCISQYRSENMKVLILKLSVPTPRYLRARVAEYPDGQVSFVTCPSVRPKWQGLRRKTKRVTMSEPICFLTDGSISIYFRTSILTLSCTNNTRPLRVHSKYIRKLQNVLNGISQSERLNYSLSRCYLQ